MSRWMIYGAYGFTGKLIALEAKRRGLKPVLAGRDPVLCQELGESLNMEVRVFSCSSAAEIASHLHDIDLVLHCAGPFSVTSAPMLEACIKAKAHYLDITGEIAVFEAIHSQSQRLQSAGVVAIPGVGFDVVPTDCLAALLKEKLPQADHLILGLKSTGRISSGTVKTMIEGLGRGGAVRKNGKIVEVPPAYKTRYITFDDGPEKATTIGWGDISTAYYSTGIPNIEVYVATSTAAITSLKLLRPLRRILEKKLIQNVLKNLASKFVKGPTENERKAARCYLWGQVSSADGTFEELKFELPEAYSFTVAAALAATERVLEGKVAPGAWTPSKAFGSQFLESLN